MLSVLCLVSWRDENQTVQFKWQNAAILFSNKCGKSESGEGRMPSALILVTWKRTGHTKGDLQEVKIEFHMACY